MLLDEFQSLEACVFFESTTLNDHCSRNDELGRKKKKKEVCTK